MQMIKDYEINKVPSPFIISKTKKRLTLILDLDETLIHLRQKKQIVNIKNDINININNLKEKKNYLLQFRVGLFSFLTLLKPFYDAISETKQKLLDKYGEPKEDGTWFVKKESIPIFTNEWNNFMDIDNFISLEKIKIEDLEEEKLGIELMEKILEIISN